MNRLCVLDAEAMRKADEGTIEELGIGQEVLMERAALAVVKHIRKEQACRILCVCGTGNNGGDAVAVARILCMQGMQTDVYMCGNPDKYKPAVKKQLEIFRKINGRTVTDRNFTEYDMIVDGILGIGTDRFVEGEYAQVINAVNEAHEKGTIVISVDIPSGLHTDTGRILSTAVKADQTVTFAYYKPGHLLYPGAEYCGKITVEDIGISYQYFFDANNTFTVAKKEKIDLPKRRRDGNKGTFGRVLVIAGSKSMYGACYLSALATLRMGVGLVDIYTHEVNQVAMQTMLPEAILHIYGDDGIDKEILSKLMEQADCVLVGPGISVDDIAEETVSFVLENCEKSLVVDADALNCIAKNKDLLYNQNRFANREIIITPHPGELSRLTDKSIAQLKENYIHVVEAFAKQYRLIVVGKDAGTVVSDGCNVYLNQTGNEGMATAGSGDVLSGIIAGLCVQGEVGFDAAWKGVYLHGRAGDYALEHSNSYSLIAGDIVNALTQII